MTEASHAIFLSYASQDAEAAQKICEALRAAGIEVFLDQSELRGGEAWDQKIRREIRDCALFVPVISVNTASRLEGYFRLEWKLAVDRSHLMAAEKPFLLPVVIDATQESNAHVPDRFREVQWTRLPGGDTSPFVERVRRLLSGESPQEPGIQSAPARAATAAAATIPRPAVSLWRSKAALLGAIAVVVIALGYLVANRLVFSKRGAVVGAPTAPATEITSATAFDPPAHSIAVLPFVNLSGDASQDYFSDGLTEELLNSLAQINELQVAARTSSFSFKEHPDIASVAHKLNVGAVLEGSVRRSAHTVRITVQLINAVTGFHLWSKTYDRDLGDVLKLQTEIATAVASALKVTLLGDVAAKVELGGTRNPAAFDSYLRGAKSYSSVREGKDIPAAIAAYTEAIRLDPHYALAFAARSMALTIYTSNATRKAASEGLDKAKADASQSLELAPDLAQAHLALASVWDHTLEFTHANDEYERALALAPGNAQVLRQSGLFAAYMGRFDAALAALRRAVVLDPIGDPNRFYLGSALNAARRYEEAVAEYTRVISLAPDFNETYAERGFAYYALGDLNSAHASCETKPDFWFSQQCLAVIFDKIGRHADAEVELTKLKVNGDAAAYQYATIYAQWGNNLKALEWLETALRLRDPGLVRLKVEPLLDPLRNEPRFQALIRKLKFPS
jgi:TolB-like protein/tetratricopeptide (TPR) repeat protein